MTYIDKNSLPGEEILFATKKHLIIFFYPLVLTILSVYAYEYMNSNFLLTKIALVPALISLFFWGSTGLEYAMSEFIVTNKRVMMREGLFYKHANEVRITTISQVNLDQSLLGQLLNYGTISINTFGGFDSYTIIDHPELFRRYINEQLDKITSK